MTARAALLASLLLTLAATSARAADPPRQQITVDCAKSLGPVRPLHGVNHGPLDGGGLVDLSKHYRDARFPHVRLHDVHWPNPDVVDMHVVFPDPAADPERPESYDFAATDDLVRAVDAAGGKVVYRLGESIEHTPRKRHAHPPKDVDRWAAAAVGIVRHYEEGFAGGPKVKVAYWEIWNEPENRPSCWTGTDEDYFRLYAATARAIKAKFPAAKVGGPAVGNSGKLNADGSLEPSPFFVGFLDFCRREKLPLDFCSWHTYTDDPAEPAARARAVRKLLDSYGFEKTESHLNEWNYLPGNDWGPVLLQGQGEPRRRFLDRMHSAEGAVFTASALINLHDAPVDVANYFTANIGGFGLFDDAGVPKKSYHALAAFGRLAGTRVAASAEGIKGARAVASLAEDGRVSVIVAWSAPAPQSDQSTMLVVSGIPWTGAAKYDLHLLDEPRGWGVSDQGHRPIADGGVMAFPIHFTGPGVALLSIRPGAQAR